MEVVSVHRKIRIETDRLILRDLVMEDATMIAERIAPIEVSKFLATVPHPYTLADAESHLKKVTAGQEKAEREEYSFAIVPKVGQCFA
jgi:RimJ/RimL family protein N-acetyltransferase